MIKILDKIDYNASFDAVVRSLILRCNKLWCLNNHDQVSLILLILIKLFLKINFDSTIGRNFKYITETIAVTDIYRLV